MIKLKLAFDQNTQSQDIEIVEGELLSTAIERVTKDVPLNGFERHEIFRVAVNGLIIDQEFWATVSLKPSDVVVIYPKISSGESGQIFKQAVILAVAIVASVYLTPATGMTIASGLAVAAVTIGATLLMNALIPPLVPDFGSGFGSGGGVEDSQMYAISGQSNQMRRLGTVPKVYGYHRIFPTLAAIPYTELAVDRTTKETIQYFYAIYDFGLGTFELSDLKIGDTDLTTNNFKDFIYRLVDPNKPGIPADDFDTTYESEFKYYKTQRHVTPLSLALNVNGTEQIQFTDENVHNYPQEIILDFVCPRGLYGYNSSGVIGLREVKLTIYFAPVGSNNWQAYNDLNYVDSHKSVGGDDITEFDNPVTPSSSNTYYNTRDWGRDSNNHNKNWIQRGYISHNTNKLLMPDSSRYQVGAKVFYGQRFLGYIQSLDNTVGPNTVITLDRIINNAPYELPVFSRPAQRRYNSTLHQYEVVYGDYEDIFSLTFTRHETGAAVIDGNKTSPVYANFRFTPKTPGQYQVRVRRITTFGDNRTSVSDNVTWTALSTIYKINPVSTDKRHVFLELKIRATDQLNGNLQNLSGQVSSILPVYDPDTATWTRQVTNNPAWVFCDLLTGEVNKRAIPVSRLHMESIVEWANYCDEIPTPPPDGTYENPRFQANFVLDYQATLQEVLGQLGGMSQSSLNIIDGKYGVLIDKFKDTPVQIFTPRNSKDFNSSRLYGPRPHGVKVKYIDPNLDWDVSEVIVYDDDYTEETAIEFDELTAFACTNYEQAWRYGRYMMAQNKLRQETISITVDFENLVCTRGDYVQITQDVMRAGGTPARVIGLDGNRVTIDDSLDINEDIAYGYVYRNADNGIDTDTLTPVSPNEFDLDGTLPEIGDLIVIGEVGKIVYDCIVKSINPNDDMSATLTLVEKADAIFEYESSSVLPDYDPQISETSNPDKKPPRAVTELTVADNFYECAATMSGYAYIIDLIWDIPAGSVYEFFEIWVNDGRGYSKWDQTSSKLYRYEVNQARLNIEHGFKVVAVAASGKKLELIAMTEVFATPLRKTDPPSNVLNFSMNITNQVLQLAWTPIDDCDAASYEIRFSPDTNDIWESSVPLQIVAKTVNSVSVQARTGVYFIKAVDYAGNQSESPASVVTTIPNLFDLNIIETINDAPDFDGTAEQVVLLGEAVILDEEVSGDVETVKYYSEGHYSYADILDLGEIYTVRLQSLIRADGFRYGELMSEWESLEDIEHLNTATSDDWDVAAEYRATDVFAAMADWEHLYDVDAINFGLGVGFTDWRPIPTTGDATGRIFQFRVALKSYTANVTPRLFDATIKADMPDRIDSFENQLSSAIDVKAIVYDQVFKGPGTSPNVQISIDNAQTGDYWVFDYKTLEGFGIRFFDKNGVQVARQFDVVAKGYGRQHAVTI